MPKIAMRTQVGFKAACVLFAVMLSASAGAQVYKWVDSKGVTHYDDKPPENLKSKEVKLKDATQPAAKAAPVPAGAGAPPPGGPPGTPPAGKPGAPGAAPPPAPGAVGAKGGDASVQEKERAFRQRQAAREEADAKQAKDREKLEAACKEARINLADMRQSPRLYDMNDKGERVFMSDKQRDDTIAAAEKEYNQNCR
jgi:hypothetical protein